MAHQSYMTFVMAEEPPEPGRNPDLLAAPAGTFGPTTGEVAGRTMVPRANNKERIPKCAGSHPMPW